MGSRPSKFNHRHLESLATWCSRWCRVVIVQGSLTQCTPQIGCRRHDVDVLKNAWRLRGKSAARNGWPGPTGRLKMIYFNQPRATAAESTGDLGPNQQQQCGLRGIHLLCVAYGMPALWQQVGIDEYRVVEWHKKVAPSVKDLNSVKQVRPPGPVQSGPPLQEYGFGFQHWQKLIRTHTEFWHGQFIFFFWAQSIFYVIFSEDFVGQFVSWS